jgi:hypothetical protein
VKKVILDENLPVDLRLHLSDFSVFTVSYLGWGGVQNGDLIKLVEQEFEVFVTGDKKLRYQQNLRSRRVAIIELPDTRLAAIQTYLEEIRQAIRQAEPGSYTAIRRP